MQTDNMTFTTHSPAPLTIPWRGNFHLHQFYREKPKYFWWLVLKEYNDVPIIPKTFYHMLPDYDLKSDMVMWIFSEVKHPFYTHFEKETWLYHFYFADDEEALMFKLMWGNI